MNPINELLHMKGTSKMLQKKNIPKSDRIRSFGSTVTHKKHANKWGVLIHKFSSDRTKNLIAYCINSNMLLSLLCRIINTTYAKCISLKEPSELLANLKAEKCKKKFWYHRGFSLLWLNYSGIDKNSISFEPSKGDSKIITRESINITFYA